MSPTALRELLELAAKAAGMRLGYATGEWAWHASYDGLITCHTETIPTVFAPHLDDGDSRRLQVACQIQTDCDGLRVRVSWWEGIVLCERSDLHNGDPLGKMRELVLCAAAEQGRAMP